MLGSPDLSLLRFLCLEEMKATITTILNALPPLLVLLFIVVDLTLLLQESNFRRTGKYHHQDLLHYSFKKDSLELEMQQGGWVGGSAWWGGAYEAFVIKNTTGVFPAWSRRCPT